MQNTTNTNQNETLLNTLYKACKLSIHSIEDVIIHSKNTTFQNAISDAHSAYQVISKECEMLAKSFHFTLAKIDCLQKFKNWATVQMDALLDGSTSNLSKILYGGTACEIAEVIVDMCKCEQADPDVLKLAEKLSDLQEKHIHTLKTHLCTKD